MKILNVIRAKTPVSDTVTDDPISQSGQSNIKMFFEDNIPEENFLYWIKLGDKHCTRVDYGDAFELSNGVLNGAPFEIISRIKSRTATLVLSWPLESFMEDSIFLKIHEYFTFHNIPLSAIIYLNCCANGKELYQSFCNRHSITTDKIIVEYIPWYLYDKSQLSLPYKPGKRSKIFLGFNRRMHEHRCLLVAWMHKENLLDRSFVSFPSHHVGTNENFLEKVKNYNHLFDQYGITDDDIKNLNNKLPLTLDIDNWNPYPLPIISNRLNVFYERSLISLVSETFFYSNTVHLTEKTFKPIINHHPFITISAPGTLKAIKSFGFRTFDTIIDESYDEIDDHNLRFNAILNIIRDMSLWGTKKIANASFELKETVEFNCDLLKSRPRIELNNFVDKYGVES